MAFRKNILFWSVIYLTLGGVVFILGLNYFDLISEQYQDAYKIGTPVLFLLLLWLSQKSCPKQKAVFTAYALVSLGWLLDLNFTGEVKGWLPLNNHELSGFAYTMVISTFFVCTPVILGWLISGRGAAAIFLQADPKRLGLITGLMGLLLFGGYGVFQALSQGLAVNALLRAIPLMLLFSLANGFREELVYRAVFLKGFQENIGTAAAITVTTIVFALAHLNVSYMPPDQVIFAVVLMIIGIVGSLVMIKTGSMIGAVVFHAGADFLLLLGMVGSQQQFL